MGETGVPRDQWPELMLRAQAGDRQAYAQLLRTLVPVIRAIVRKQIDNDALVEDAIQDVLLTVHRVRHTYDPASPFLPWLMAITRARAIDALRRQGRFARREVAEDPQALDVADSAPVRQAERLDSREELYGFLNQLPARQRQIVENIHLEEMSLVQAAKENNLSRSATPVKRVPPVGLRVGSWMLMALPAGVLASFLLERCATDWSQPGAVWAMAQLLIVFTLGLLATQSAFASSIAGRRPLRLRWLLLLAGGWFVSVAMSLGYQPLSASSLTDTHCYTFMVTVSAPMIALALGYLRRTRTLTPVRSLLLSGVGVSCMALTLLLFCHPVHLHPEDFLMHLSAIATIMATTLALGWRWVRA